LWARQRSRIFFEEYAVALQYPNKEGEELKKAVEDFKERERKREERERAERRIKSSLRADLCQTL
jgi:predicted Zn-dependent peptidase